MSELKKIEEAVGGLFGNNHELKPVGAPYEAELVKAGEQIISRGLLNEIKMRRSQGDINTLIGAVEKLLDLLEHPDNFSWGPKAEEPAPEPEELAAKEAETPAEEPEAPAAEAAPEA